MNEMDGQLTKSMRKKLIDELCSRYELSEAEIMQLKQGGRVKEARQVGILAAYEVLTKSKVIIAEMFGLKRPHSITEIIDNAQGLRDTDRAFKGQVEFIKSRIA